MKIILCLLGLAGVLTLSAKYAPNTHAFEFQGLSVTWFMTALVLGVVVVLAGTVFGKHGKG